MFSPSLSAPLTLLVLWSRFPASLACLHEGSKATLLPLLTLACVPLRGLCAIVWLVWSYFASETLLALLAEGACACVWGDTTVWSRGVPGRGTPFHQHPSPSCQTLLLGSFIEPRGIKHLRPPTWPLPHPVIGMDAPASDLLTEGGS